MGSKKKRKSVTTVDEQPSKRSGSQQGHRSGGGGGGSGGGGGGSTVLAWGSHGVTATLSADQALVLAGCAQLTVQSGEVAVFGSVVSAATGPVEVAADERGDGALLLEPIPAAGTVPLAASGPAVVLTLSRAGGAGSTGNAGCAGDAAQQAQQDQQDGIAAEQRRQDLGFGVWLRGDPSAPALPPPLPPLWHQAAAEVAGTAAGQHGGAGGAAPVVVAVCGAKKVGKSTFARLLVNSLLSQHPCVAYLDTDCGQPEFTAPGLVSLTLLTAPAVGPPHLHQRRPAAALFVGDVSPANDPVRYLQHVRDLWAWYCQHGAAAAAAAARGGGGQGAAAGGQQQQQQQQPALPPLVVNTHGWVKGMGFDLLAELLQGLPVSHLVQIAAANPKKNLPPGAFWLPDPAADGGAQAQPQVLQWVLPGLGEDSAAGAAQPAVSDTSARSVATYGAAAGAGGAADPAAAGGGTGGAVRGRLHAVEQRALHWEALARQCIASCGCDGGGRADVAVASLDLGDQLAAAVPYEVDASDLEVQVLHSGVPPSQLYYALNGAVVGLCAPPPPAQPQCLSAAAPATAPPLCLGLGIVRAVDAVQRRLYILTAVPEEEVELVRVLQLGRLELPASLLQTAAHMSPYLALHSLSSAGTGAGAIKSRNNLLRQSQL